MEIWDLRGVFKKHTRNHWGVQSKEISETNLPHRGCSIFNLQ